MDGRILRPQLKDLQTEASWFPATPPKPALTNAQAICKKKQENPVNWSESDRLSQGNNLGQADCPASEGCSAKHLSETQLNSVLPHWVETSEHFDNWQKTLAAKLHGNNGGRGNKCSLDSEEGLNGMTFGSLLALAEAAAATEPSTNAAAQANVNASSSLFHSIFNIGIEDGYSHYGQSSSDFNMPPSSAKNTADVVSPQIAPMTPEQIKGGEKSQVHNVPCFMIDGIKIAKDKLTNEVNNVRVEIREPHCDAKQLQVPENNSCATITQKLQETHNLDKGGNEGADFSKTPHQKPRRRKHRPRVVIEGKTMRTPRPATPKPPNGSIEMPSVKRTYVRKKGIEPTDPDKVPSGNMKYVLTNQLGQAQPEKTSTGKRKYFWINGLNNNTSAPSVEFIKKKDPETTANVRKSCRRSLNFDCDGQMINERSSGMPLSNLYPGSHTQNIYTRAQSESMQLGQGMGVTLEKETTGDAYDITRCTTQDCLSMSDKQASRPSTHLKIGMPHHKLAADQIDCTREICQNIFSNQTHNKEARSAEIMVNTKAQSATRSSKESNCSSSTRLTHVYQTRRQKREHSCTTDTTELYCINGTGARHNSLQACISMFSVNGYNNNNIPEMHFPKIYKKKRSEKRQHSATSCSSSTASAQPISETKQRICTAQINANGVLNKLIAVTDTSGIQHIFENMQTVGHKERLTKKRSKFHTKRGNLKLPTGTVECKQFTFLTEEPTSSGELRRLGVSPKHHTGMEGLVAKSCATMGKKEKNKKDTPPTLVPPQTYEYHQCITKSQDPSDKVWKCMPSIDDIIQLFECLNINRDMCALIPYNTGYLQRNTLVLYQRDGTLVQFEQVKRKRPRPKVDLDDETNRVWKLLLENINSQGIDGTNEEKARWWEEERRIFRGRADSFIARMHLVQGDRRFSRWKGSVLDSVIGVFLTQNVSDHLSSSAFMSLAARFPLKFEKGPSHKRMTDILVEEPEECVFDPDKYIIRSNEKANQPDCDLSSLTILEVDCSEEDVASGNEYSGHITVTPVNDAESKLLESSKIELGIYDESAGNGSTTQSTGTAANFVSHQREMNVFSSQTSVASSENFLDSNADRVRNNLQSTPEAELTSKSDLNSVSGITSFVELLQKVGTSILPGVHDQVSNEFSRKRGQRESKFTTYNSQEQNKHGSEDPQATISSSNNCFHVDSPSAVLPVGCSDMFNTSKRNEEDSASEQSGSSAESATNTKIEITFASSQKVSKLHSEFNLQFDNNQAELDKTKYQNTPEDSMNKMQQIPEIRKFSAQVLKVTGSTNVAGDLRKNEQTTVESNLSHPYYIQDRAVDTMNVEASKEKRGRSKKEKEIAVNWDDLRKQAQGFSNGRERTADTMDSLDWEAVRCADVEEIADTIKERGMNNRLAERIKDLLDRLVSEHGSTDLEWLRDVPPDKAKDYLLSIKGLGLKSVECVRLLTLHQLAFPVDTNVGRIAVRLGWVPLQPLPDSLQLHLLELYPVLESIQKYLWPRLCKLDQKTLYELHYQMITFGKVFCTKSKPNCNACPMRGECRHFASAFASARLALPAPEEKCLVVATENKAEDQNPRGTISMLHLPHPQVSENPEIQCGCCNPNPVTDKQQTLDPIVEIPDSPGPEQAHVSESDSEDVLSEDPDEIPTIKLNIEEFTHNLQTYMQHKMSLQEGEMSKALVALTPEAASIPMPKLKNVSQLRTEHQVYELPDSHPLLEGLDKREPDDPSSYLLAIWTPGETANSIGSPETCCSFQESGELCNEETCFSCNNLRETNTQTVRGTLLIPCRTAMRGSFPLNGTYFQVNEVFADHESSLNPICVPRAWIWNLPRRTVYFGTSIPTIFKGLTTEGIQYCFWRGFVCVRGFDLKTRAPRPLMARLHIPISKLTRTRGES